MAVSGLKLLASSDQNTTLSFSAFSVDFYNNDKSSFFRNWCASSTFLPDTHFMQRTPSSAGGGKDGEIHGAWQ
jgi:hypothetical protein